MRSRRVAATASLWLSFLAGACAYAPPEAAFVVEPLPAVARFERPRGSEAFGNLLDPQFSVPTHLRPCCAFGRDLEVRVSSLAVPLVEISNVVDPTELGRHAYDGGLISLRNPVHRAFVSTEANGLVYTCRAGFIDVAHVRDYADWTVFLARRLEATLETGVALELPAEGARRFVFVKALDPDLIERVGRRPLAAQLAQWLTFHLSLWHEAATWYGWSSIELFPERGSAFSPEDLYSNLLGTNIASYVLQSGMAENEQDYSRAMDERLTSVLELLGATPIEVTRRALDAVEGLWWSSKRRLPDARVLLRRNLDYGPHIAPWTIPSQRVSLELQADHAVHCGDRSGEPVVLSYPTEVEGIPFSEIARVDLRAGPMLRRRIPSVDPSNPWLDQQDLPLLIQQIRTEGLFEFGQLHELPDAEEPKP